MSTMYENIMALCEESGIKAGKMCNDLGLSRSLMTDLKAGRKKGVTNKTAVKIAEYFGVSVDRVFGIEKTASPEDEAVWDFREDLRRNEVRVLLKSIRDMSGEEIEAMADFAKRLKGVK